MFKIVSFSRDTVTTTTTPKIPSTALNFEGWIFTCRVWTNYLRQITVLSDSYSMFWNKCCHLITEELEICLTKFLREAFAALAFSATLIVSRHSPRLHPLRRCIAQLSRFAFYHISSAMYQQERKALESQCRPCQFSIKKSSRIVDEKR